MTGRRWAAAVVVVSILAGASFVVLTRDDSSETPRADGTSSTTSTDGPSTEPPTEPPTDALPLGTVKETGPASGSCPSGFDCSGFSVQCPAVAGEHTGVLAVAEPKGDVRGMVVLFSGGSGESWWDDGQPEAGAFLDDVLSDGLEVVEVQWSGSWLVPDTDDSPGIAALACRPASVLRYVYDQRYVPLGLGRGDGVCGFCASGNSGGASQVAFALSHYGLDSIIDVAVTSSGPPHAAIARGCLHDDEGDSAIWYSVAQAHDIDTSFGTRQGGACVEKTASFVDTWNANDPAFGGSDHRYDNTSVVVMLGDRDTTVAPGHARIYVEQLQAAGSPHVDVEEVPSMSHRIEISTDGLAVLRKALLGT